MSTTPHTRAGREAGLTLIEVLISMIILGIITTMLVVVWVNLQRGAVFAMQASNATSTARDAIARVGTELRLVGTGGAPEVLMDALPLPITSCVEQCGHWHPAHRAPPYAVGETI